MPRLQLCPFPGGKAKLRPMILPHLLALAEDIDTIVDVFAGAGGFAFGMMAERPNLQFIINDADSTLIALWLAVRHQPCELVKRIDSFQPNEADFNIFRNELRSVTRLPTEPVAILEVGFRRLAYQTMAHSGMMDGGKRKDLALKWNPSWIKARARICSQRMRFPRSVQIVNGDFVPMIADATQRLLLMCDPPYWPTQRYHHKFSLGDHARLAEMLRLTPHRFIVTLGDHPVIRRLYRWAAIEQLGEYEGGTTLLITREPSKAEPRLFA